MYARAPMDCLRAQQIRPVSTRDAIDRLGSMRSILVRAVFRHIQRQAEAASRLVEPVVEGGTGPCGYSEYA